MFLWRPRDRGGRQPGGPDEPRAIGIRRYEIRGLSGWSPEGANWSRVLFSDADTGGDGELCRSLGSQPCEKQELPQPRSGRASHGTTENAPQRDVASGHRLADAVVAPACHYGGLNHFKAFVMPNTGFLVRSALSRLWASCCVLAVVRNTFLEITTSRRRPGTTCPRPMQVRLIPNRPTSLRDTIAG